MADRGESASPIRERMSSLLASVIRRGGRSQGSAPAPNTLRVTRYKLILMDQEGQEVWSGEWDTGGAFEFAPRSRLLVFCEYTNHSKTDANIAEYEIELVGRDESIVARFGSAFGDSIVLSPGQSRVLTGEWQR